MSASGDTDFIPSDDEESEEQQIMVEGGESSDDYSSKDEDDKGFFDEGAENPLDFVHNMEISDRAPYELLRRRNRRRSKRVSRQQRAAERAIRAVEGQRGSEEESEEDDDAGEAMEEDEELEGEDGDGGDGQGPLVNSDGEEYIEDEWNEALAERFGMSIASRKKLRSREKYRRRHGSSGRRDLPEEVNKKLGQANMHYINQEFQDAIALLQDVVRLAPNASDAYHLLGVIYEETGDMKKALNFFMIAAHLTPKQPDLWRRLADMSSKQGLIRQAVYCLTQVIKRDRDDIDARYDRALFLQQLGQPRKAIEGLESVRVARPEHPEVAKQLARLYYHSGQVDKAVQAVQEYWDAYPATTDLTHVNLLAELLCTPDIERWQDVLDVLGRCRRELLSDETDMPVELEVKEALATARLGDIEGAEKLLEVLFDHPVAAFDDLFFAAADIFESLGRDEKAEPFLQALADDPVTSRPDVWKRLAECRRRLHGPNAAVEVWQHFTADIDRNHFGFMDAIVALADAMRAAGDEDGAAQALARLANDVPGGSFPGLEALTSEEDLVQRANVLKACGRQDLLVSLALPSLQATLGALAGSDPDLEEKIAKRARRSTRRSTAGGGPSGDDAVFVGYVSRSDRRRSRRQAERASEAATAAGDAEDEDPSGALTIEAEVGGLLLTAPVLPGLLKQNESFQLMVDVCLSLLHSGRENEARRLAELAVDVLAKKSPNKKKRDTMRLLAGMAALTEGDLQAALGFLKSPATRWNASPAPWNAFSQMQTAAGGARQAIKFLTPLRLKNPTSLPLALMLGHAHLQHGSYVTALGEYFQAYRFAPDEPLVLLCIAIGLVNHAASKHVHDRNSAVLQAFGFMQEYSRRRRDPVESAYNVGRAAQHLNLSFLAVPMYEKALALGKKERKESVAQKMLTSNGTSGAAAEGAMEIDGAAAEGGAVIAKESSVHQYEVTPESAFNLALIYRASGATTLAKQLLREHLTF